MVYEIDAMPSTPPTSSKSLAMGGCDDLTAPLVISPFSAGGAPDSPEKEGGNVCCGSNAGNGGKYRSPFFDPESTLDVPANVAHGYFVLMTGGLMRVPEVRKYTRPATPEEAEAKRGQQQQEAATTPKGSSSSSSSSSSRKRNIAAKTKLSPSSAAKKKEERELAQAQQGGGGEDSSTGVISEGQEVELDDGDGDGDEETGDAAAAGDTNSSTSRDGDDDNDKAPTSCSSRGGKKKVKVSSSPTKKKSTRRTLKNTNMPPPPVVCEVMPPQDPDDANLSVAFLALTDGNVIDTCFGVKQHTSRLTIKSSKHATRASKHAKELLRSASESHDAVRLLAVEAYSRCFEIILRYHKSLADGGIVGWCWRAKKIRDNAVKDLVVAFDHLSGAVEASL